MRTLALSLAVAVLLVLLSVPSFTSATGLKCWVCNSNDDAGCTAEYHDFNWKETPGIKKMDCSQVPIISALSHGQIHTRTRPATSCYKSVVTIHGKTTVTRSCASPGDKIPADPSIVLESVESTSCSSSTSTINGVTQQFDSCTCNWDYCNGNGDDGPTEPPPSHSDTASENSGVNRQCTGPWILLMILATKMFMG